MTAPLMEMPLDLYTLTPFSTLLHHPHFSDVTSLENLNRWKATQLNSCCRRGFDLVPRHLLCWLLEGRDKSLR